MLRELVTQPIAVICGNQICINLFKMALFLVLEKKKKL